MAYKLKQSGDYRERRNYSMIKNSLELDDLLQIQKESYQWFVKEGIKEVFEDSLQNDGTNYLANENFEKVLEEAITQSGIQEKNLLITGSFYLVAEAKKVLLAISSRESSEIV